MVDHVKQKSGNDIVSLKDQIGNISDQLCLAVKGDFSFTVQVQTTDESIQKLTMLVNFVIDTARRALIDLQDKNTKLVEMDQIKSDFMANISHELRTPLTLILGPLGSILSHFSQNMPQQHLENLQRIQRNASRLYVLVNDLLDFSKIEAGKFETHEELLDVNQLLLDIVDDAQGLAVERKLILKFYPCEGLNLMLFDRKMLEKVGLNLISNALKFTPAGGSIKVQLTHKEDSLLLAVEDTGIGIPASQISKLFERFHQVDTSSTRAYEGTGIGLALIKQFAHLMHGDILVESEEGKGSKFVVTLPIPLVSEEEKKEDLGIPKGNQAQSIKISLSQLAIHDKQSDHSSSDKGDARSKKPLIVVADDNIDMRSYIVSLLEDTYEIIAVENGKLALEATNKYSPQIILSDVMMPLMDGYELTKTIKANPQTKNIPVILITARAGKEATVSGFEIGADDYLPKPFSPEELKARTASALRLHENFVEVMNLNDQMKNLVQELSKSNQELKTEVEERKKLEAKNAELNNQLIISARRAGMADISTSVLHNVGNVLNSVNMSVTVISNKITHSKVSNLLEIKNLLSQNQQNFKDFLENSPQGQRIPSYLCKLADIWEEDKKVLTEEMNTLNHSIQHIKEIVVKQNTFSASLGVVEEVSIAAVVDDALLLNKTAYERSKINIIRDFKPIKSVVVDRVKLLQIMVNLIKNSLEATVENNTSNKSISLRISEKDKAHIMIQVADNGIGILPENLKKMFSYGFTTKKGGHGFGLHVSAVAVQEMGGKFIVESQGAGKGATFTLILPYKPLKRKDEEHNGITTKTHVGH